MRLIDADALIEDVKTLWDYETVDGITSSTVLKQIVTDIQNAPTIPAPRWVRCKEELPKPGQLCLVYDEDDYMSVATYTGDKYFPTAYGFHVNGEEVTDITHWMPIEPPREDA